jgi:hypothetical protein
VSVTAGPVGATGTSHPNRCAPSTIDKGFRSTSRQALISLRRRSEKTV